MSESTTGSDSKKALLEAFDRVLETQAEERAAHRANTQQRGVGRHTVITLVAVFVLLFTLAYLWFERPPWLFPPPPPPESAAVKDASLRITLANAARHVEQFRRKHGRLPASLGETGALAGGIMYEPAGMNGYMLRGVNGPVQLTLRSTDSLRSFLGNSFEVIARRTR